MRTICGPAARRTGCFVLLSLLISEGAVAHVALDAPLGGEALLGGFPFTIEWRVAIPHDTENWDLWYSTESNDGPWLEIATDLPKGDIGAGAAHSFQWMVPYTDIPTAWVRVRQDNASEDYYYVSNSSFDISLPVLGDFTGNGVVDGDDLAQWQASYGTNSDATFAEGDADVDGDVDGSDFIDWQRNEGTSSSLVAATTIPEPTTWSLLAFAMAVSRVRNHRQ